MCVCVAFSYLFISGSLGGFDILATVSSAAVNVGVQLSFRAPASILLVMYTEAELLDHVVVLFFIFWGTVVLISTVAIPCYSPTNSVQRFQLLHILPALVVFFCCCCCVVVVCISHPNRCEVISNCSFDLHFPND